MSVQLGDFIKESKMKKALFLVCFFLTSCLAPEDGFNYTMSTDSTEINPGNISLYTRYELPQSHVKNFMDTIILFLTEQELKEDIDISFNYKKQGESFSTWFYSDTEVAVTSNGGFDSNINDPKSIEYYTDVLSFEESHFEVKNEMQIYLRQDKGSEKINYMIMIKPYKASVFEYLGHTTLKEMVISPAGGSEKPLPDVFK